MRNLVLGVVGLGVVALALPIASANAEETIVIKKHRQYNRDWDRHHRLEPTPQESCDPEGSPPSRRVPRIIFSKTAPPSGAVSFSPV